MSQTEEDSETGRLHAAGDPELTLPTAEDAAGTEGGPSLGPER